MTDDNIYHIYVKNRCIYHNLQKGDFKEKWDMLNKMVGLMKTMDTRLLKK